MLVHKKMDDKVKACLQMFGLPDNASINEYCKKLNQQDNCSLPSGAATVLEQRYSQMRNECYRLNPQ